MAKKKVLATLALLLGLSAPAEAYDSSGQVVTTVGEYFSQVPMTPIVRPANATPYSANQIVCGSSCVPMAMALGQSQSPTQTTAFLNRLVLLKSGSNQTNATFTVLLFSKVPTVPAGDQVAYVGPYLADIPNYLGQASCSTPNATNDGSSGTWYECQLSNPNSAGILELQRAIGSAAPTLVYGLLQVNGAYTPTSGEVFIPYLSGVF